MTPQTAAHQAPLSMGFSRQEYWSGLPFPSSGNFPNPGIKPGGFLHWRRKWQPTPVFLPGEAHGQGSLVGCRLWGRSRTRLKQLSSSSNSIASSCSNPAALTDSQCDVREEASSSMPRSPGCDISAGPCSQVIRACYLIYTPANFQKLV